MENGVKAEKAFRTYDTSRVEAEVSAPPVRVCTARIGHYLSVRHWLAIQVFIINTDKLELTFFKLGNYN